MRHTRKLLTSEIVLVGTKASSKEWQYACTAKTFRKPGKLLLKKTLEKHRKLWMKRIWMKIYILPTETCQTVFHCYCNSYNKDLFYSFAQHCTLKISHCLKRKHQHKSKKIKQNVHHQHLVLLYSHYKAFYFPLYDNYCCTTVCGIWL